MPIPVNFKIFLKIFTIVVYYILNTRHVKGQCITPIDCYNCDYKHYNNDFQNSYRLSSYNLPIHYCKLKNFNFIKRQILILNSECLECIYSNFDSIYENIPTAFEKENNIVISYFKSDIIFYLQKGVHYINEQDFSFKNEELFRYSFVNITIKSLENTYAEIHIKTNEFYLFISKNLYIKNINFYANDINNKCSKTFCCLEEDFVNSLSSCYLYEKKIELDLMRNDYKGLFNIEYIFDNPEINDQPQLLFINCSFNLFYPILSKGFHSLISLAPYSGEIILDNCLFKNNFFPFGIIIFSNTFDKYYDLISKIINENPLFKNNILSLNEKISIKNCSFLNYNKYFIEINFNTKIINLNNFFKNVSIIDSLFLNISNTNFLLWKNEENKGYLNLENNYFSNGIKLNFDLLENLNEIKIKNNIINNFEITDFLFIFTDIKLIIIDNLKLLNLSLKNNENSLINLKNSNFILENSLIMNSNQNCFLKQSLMNSTLSNTLFFMLTFKNNLLSFESVNCVNIIKSNFNLITGSLSLIYLSTSNNLTIEKTIIEKTILYYMFFIVKSYNHLNYQLIVKNNNIQYFWKPEQSLTYHILNYSIINNNTIFERFIHHYFTPNVFFLLNNLFMISNNMSSQFGLVIVIGTLKIDSSIFLNNYFLNPNRYNFFFGFNTIVFFTNSYSQDNGVINKKTIYGSYIENSMISAWNSKITIINVNFILTKKIEMASGFITGSPVTGPLTILDSQFIFFINSEFEYKGMILDSFQFLTLKNLSFTNLGCNQRSFSHRHGGLLLTGFPGYKYSKNSFKVEIYNTSFYNCSCYNGGNLAILSINSVFIKNCSFHQSKSRSFGGAFLLIANQYTNLSNLIIFDSIADDGAAFYLFNLLEITIFEIKLNNIISKGNGVIFIKNVKKINIYNIISNNTLSYLNGGFIYCFGSNMIMYNIVILNSSSLLEGGAFFFNGEPNIFFNNLTIQQSLSEKGGSISIINAGNIIINNSVFINSNSNKNGAVIFLDVIKSIILQNLILKNCSSYNGYGIIYVKTEEQNSSIFWYNLECKYNTAISGSCFYYIAASILNIMNLKISFNSGTPIHIFWSFIIRINMENCIFSNNILNTYLIYFFGVELNFINSEINYNDADFPLIFGDYSLCYLNKLYFIDNSNNFLMKFVSSELNLSNIEAKNKIKNSLSFLISTDSIINMNKINIFGLNSSFNTLISLQKGELQINNSYFMNNLGTNLFLLYSKFILCNSIFYNNTSIDNLKPNDIILNNPTSKIIQSFFSNVSFNSNFGVSCSFLGALIVIINSSSFKNDNKINSIILKTTAIQFSDLFNFSLYNSLFFNFNQNAIQVKNDNSFYFEFTILNIINSNFSFNKGNLGGALYLEGDLHILINNSYFNNNKAIKTKDSIYLEGIGGCIFYSPFQPEKSFFQINSSIFTQNSADYFCSTIFSKLFINTNQKNYINNNSDSGTFFAFPLEPQLILPFISNELIEITSGKTIYLKFELKDSFLNKIFFDNSTLFTLKLSNKKSANKTIIIENYISKINEGVILFPNFILKISPNSYFSLVLSGEFQGLSTQKNQNNYLIQTEFNFYSRECYIGELILSDFSCYKCPKGYYSLEDPMKIDQKYQKCTECPINSECFGGDIIVPLAGFYRKRNKSTNVVPCIITEACIGYNYSEFSQKNNSNNNIINGNCLEGNTGTLCSYCIYLYGRYEKNNICKKCSDIGAIIYIRIIFYSFFMIGYIILNSHFAESNKKNNDLSSFIKQILNHGQQISVILMTSSKLHIPSLNYFFSISDYMSFGNDEVITNDCLIQSIYYNPDLMVVLKEAFIGIMPIVFTFFSLVFWILSVYLLGKTERLGYLTKKIPKNFKQLLQKIILFLVLCSFIFYSLLLKSSFSLFNCIKIDKDEKITYLKNNPDLQCWSNTHNRYLFFIGLPGIIIWGLFFPIFLFFILKKINKILTFANSSTIFSENTILNNEMKENSLKKSEINEEIKESIINIPNNEFDKLCSFLGKIPKKNSNTQIEKNKIAIEILKLVNSSKAISFFYKDFKNEFYYWESFIFFRKFIITFITSLNETIPIEYKIFILIGFLLIYIETTLKNKPYKLNSTNNLEIISLFSLLIAVNTVVVYDSNTNENIKILFLIVSICSNLVFFTYDAFLIFKSIILKFKKKKTVAGKSKYTVNKINKNKLEDNNIKKISIKSNILFKEK